MAGERSKSIGEIGENIAEKFLKKIGWDFPLKGVYFQCVEPKEHALPYAKQGEKKQHGIDFHVPYRSALESETLNHLIISVKHLKDSKYPSSATELFKSYIRDLVHTTSCFQRSPQRKETNLSFQGCKQVNDIPVLFYISSKDSADTDFSARIQSSRFMNEFDVKELYLVDNKRVSFILDVLTYIEEKHSDWESFFFYPLTGMNVADTSIMQHGKKIQVEFLTSAFIPFLLKKKIGDHETCKFLVASIDPLSENNLQKLITYCRQNTSDSVTDVEIVTDDYFADEHEALKRKIVSSIESELSISLGNFRPNFRSLADD